VRHDEQHHDDRHDEHAEAVAVTIVAVGGRAEMDSN
jgi:hypothetical protein